MKIMRDAREIVINFYILWLNNDGVLVLDVIRDLKQNEPEHL